MLFLLTPFRLVSQTDLAQHVAQHGYCRQTSARCVVEAFWWGEVTPKHNSFYYLLYLGLVPGITAFQIRTRMYKAVQCFRCVGRFGNNVHNTTTSKLTRTDQPAESHNHSRKSLEDLATDAQKQNSNGMTDLTNLLPEPCWSIVELAEFSKVSREAELAADAALKANDDVLARGCMFLSLIHI